MAEVKLLIIADPAHGIGVLGKQSPDGSHKEWIWSRARWNNIAPRLSILGYQVVWTNPTDEEIGLSKRKALANAFAKHYPELTPLLISLHNDASGNGTEWKKPNGVSVWTSKGRTNSDIMADILIQNAPNFIPEMNKRVSAQKYMDRDFENDFTVLMGSYLAMLVECGFQDNREDVELLGSADFNRRVEDWIVDSVEKCNEYVVNKLLK